MGVQDRERESARPDERPLPRWLALLLSAVFFALIVAPAIVQCIAAPHSLIVRAARFARLFAGVPSGDALSAWADDLARQSLVQNMVRRAYQEALTEALHAGSGKIIVGRDGWLFWRPDLKLLADGEISNRSLSFMSVAKAYAERAHARLVVLPVPVGPVLYPEKIWSGYPQSAGPAWGSDYAGWVARARSRGLDVLDITQSLWDAKGQGPAPWLRTDSHWSPRGVEIAADRLATHVRPLLRRVPVKRFATRALTCNFYGELMTLLDVTDPDDLFPPPRFRVNQVLEGPDLERGDELSPVLVIGDSYAAVYSASVPGHPDGADLGRQLALRLGVNVQSFCAMGAAPMAAFTNREKFEQLAKHRAVIVWEFSARFVADPASW